MGFDFNFVTGGTFNPSGILKDIYGSKPVVPDLPAVTLPEAQQKALDANIAAYPKAAKLGRLAQEQLKAMAEFAIPGFGGIGTQIAKNLAAGARGEIPTDLMQSVWRGDAGRLLQSGVGGGVGPGSAGRNLVARDLGLTSYGIQQDTLKSTESWLAAMEHLYSPSAAIFTNMFITPEKEYASEERERDLQFQRNWLVNQISAMPDPVARGVYDTVMELVGDVLSIYSGGAKHQSYQPNYGGSGGGMGGGDGGTGGINIWGWGGNSYNTYNNTDTGALSGGTGALGGGRGSALGAFI